MEWKLKWIESINAKLQRNLDVVTYNAICVRFGESPEGNGEKIWKWRRLPIAPSLNSVSEVTVVKDRLSKRKDKIEQFAR